MIFAKIGSIIQMIVTVVISIWTKLPDETKGHLLDAGSSLASAGANRLKPNTGEASHGNDDDIEEGEY